MDFKKYDIGEKSEKILKNYYEYWDGISCIEGLETLYKKEEKEVKEKILTLREDSIKSFYKDLKTELRIDEEQLQIILRALRVRRKQLDKYSLLNRLSPLLFKEVESTWDEFLEYKDYFEEVFRFIKEELEVLKEVCSEFKKELK